MERLKSVISCLLLSMILLLGVQISIFAQAGDTGANISGSVTDEQGGVIGGAIVSVSNIDTNLTRQVTSAEDGTFLVAQLPPGNYKVKVSVEGFKPQLYKLQLGLGTVTSVAVKLAISANDTEVIEVKADATVDQGKTESSTNIDSTRIVSLPIDLRDFLQFSLTTARAGVDRLPSQDATESSGFTFNSQSARTNNFTIDGLDNNEYFSGSVRSSFSQEAVQEFQVISDNYSAEFGRALSGVVNVITKSGTNDVHGDAFFIFRNERIKARDPFATFKPSFEQNQGGLTLGGPIKKDKAFFFAAFERLSFRENNIVTISDAAVAAANNQGFNIKNGPLPFGFAKTTFLGKTDFQLSANDRLSVRYNFGGLYNGSFVNFGGLTANTRSSIDKLTDNSIAVNNVQIAPNLNFINESRFLFSRRDEQARPVAPGPQVVLNADEGQISFGQTVNIPLDRFERVYQFADVLSLTRGRHQLKFGGDFSYRQSPADGNSLQIFKPGLAIFGAFDFRPMGGPLLSPLQSFDPSTRTADQRFFLTFLSTLFSQVVPGFPAGQHLEDLPLPFAFRQGFGTGNFGFNTKIFAAFAQDDIKVKPNFLLKLGIRYDVNRVTSFPKNNGNISPRIALAYQPKFLPKTTIRAAYGLFFAPPFIGFALPVNLTQQKKLVIGTIPFPFSALAFGQQGHRFPDSDVPAFPPGAFVPQLDFTFLLNPKFRNSYSQQTSFGIDYELNRNTTISATYVYIRGLKIISEEQSNTIIRPVPGDPVASATTGRPDNTKGVVDTINAASDSYYHGVSFSLNRRFSNNFTVLAHYTYGKALDNVLDIRADIADPANKYPLNLQAEKGYSLQDVRHRFVLSGLWNLNYTKNPFLRDFQLSSIITLESGRPYNLLTGIDGDMDGTNPSGERPANLARNIGITPSFKSVDMRLTRGVKVNERFKFEGFVEAFNLFNRTNIREFDRLYPPDANGNFNLPPVEDGRYIVPKSKYRGAFAPREFQFGIKLLF